MEACNCVVLVIMPFFAEVTIESLRLSVIGIEGTLVGADDNHFVRDSNACIPFVQPLRPQVRFMDAEVP
jgi:hypothetical protein